jgi:hypothetical protein
MPKNIGRGVAVRSARGHGPWTLVRLGRRDLWQRLDRNMILDGRGSADARQESDGR